MLALPLLANIDDTKRKERANELWKSRLLQLIEIDKEEQADFFKAWLRSQYADSVRERKKGATNKDFERIGTGFHKWVRDERERIGLVNSSAYNDFIQRLFERYSRHYIIIRKAATTFTPELACVYYNAHNNFTLQYPLILAAICEDDSPETVRKKTLLVSRYIDIFIARRITNFRTLGYSAIVYTMFNLMKEIRGLGLPVLAGLLKQKLDAMEETFESVKSFYLHQQNRRRIHFLLARMTYYIEKQCGVESSFVSYVSRDIKKPFEIEHIWADKYERYADTFSRPEEFTDYRNRFGGLILLPHGFNQSLSDDTYAQKVKHYYGQNLLAKSLSIQCYRNNPAFLRFIQDKSLPFRSYEREFTKKDLDERQELYQKICEKIWDPKLLEYECQTHKNGSRIR